jgi:molecular chaperone HtpG
MDNTEEIKIGVYTLDSLTRSMYSDARCIIREYLQNAADATDKAKAENLSPQDGWKIYVNIDTNKRRLEIEDNGTGIQKENISKYLRNIGMSVKQQGVDKGFRGIGRLAGLQYCKKMIFETSAQGETEKSSVIWNAAELMKIIANKTDEEAAAVINKVTEIKQDKEQADKHYFKVILEDVTSDVLLNIRDIRKYLSMVAPVPFKKSIFSPKIYEEFKRENLQIDEYDIFVNTNQVYKGYNWYVYDGDEDNKRQTDEVKSIEFFKETYNDKILYLGWYAITGKNQTLQPVNFARGFRLRSKNIQIGDETTLRELFIKDKRFQNYMFGEIYAFNSGLIRNSQGDNFVKETEEYKAFKSSLETFFANTIHTLCYAASTANSAVSKTIAFKETVEKFEKKEKIGWTDNEERDSWLQKIEDKKKKADEATQKVEKLKLKTEETSPISKILERVTDEPVKVEPLSGKPKFRTDKLSKLDKKERKFLGEIFSIINTILTSDLAENLIQKIEEKYK